SPHRAPLRQSGGGHHVDRVDARRTGAAKVPKRDSRTRRESAPHEQQHEDLLVRLPRAHLAFRRTGETSMRARLLVVAASLSLLTGAADSKVRCSGGAYSILRRDFHETVKYLPAAHAIEFCPDNTCHRFVSKRASCDDLADFLLIYLRYYSDYAVLTDWRRRDDVQRAVDQSMTGPMLRPCVAEVAATKPRCVLHKSITAHKIKGFDVRYD